MSEPKRTWSFLLLAAVTAGCSVLLDEDRVQCRASRDCRSPDGESLVCQEGLCVSVPAATRYACRGVVSREYPVDQPIEVTDFNQAGPSPTPGRGRPVAMEVRVCRDADAECASPVVPSQRTDAAGRATLRLTEPNLHVQMIPIDSDSDLYPPSDFWPADTFRTLARLGDGTTAALQVAQREISLALASFGGVTLEPAKNQIVVTTLPCPGADATGLAYEMTLANQGRYFIGASVPDFSSQMTLRGPSFPQAVGGYINVELGPGELVVRVPATSQELQRVTFRARSGRATYVLADLQAP